MESILIHTGNKEELNLLKKIATKMGFKSEILSLEEKEDLFLAKAIEENKPEDIMTFEEGMAY
jgi:hypothetical protein